MANPFVQNLYLSSELLIQMKLSVELYVNPQTTD
jgi:hypothetical protein